MKILSIALAVSGSFFVAQGLTAQNTLKKYLSGVDATHTVAWDFYCSAGRNSGEWSTIQVPSCWEQQGFGNYNYGRDYKTNGKNSRFYDETGTYRYKFTVPADWKSKTIELVFEGSMTDTDVKINGKAAGATHRGAFYQFKYPIDSLLKFGVPNELEVKVSKMSSDASVNNAERLADYWVFGGIFRPVYLQAFPKNHLSSIAINANHEGALALQLERAERRTPNSVVVKVVDAAGKQWASFKGSFNAGDSLLVLNEKIQGIRSWTSENPVLYKLLVDLLDAKGKKIHSTSESFGFRTIEVRKGRGVFINGTQVKFKGVNRHCFWPETARSLSEEQQLKDALLLKEMNMNAVRCSHYPPDAYFLHLCDSLGIYVLDELAGWQKAYSTKAGEPLVKEMVLRDRNHPSIVFWDNGNEGGTNKDLDDDFVKWDFQQRPVIHPHHRPGNDFNGIDCNHYEDFYSTRKILGDSLIYMPTEFLHAQDDGGGGAGMEDFWNLHWKSSKSAGGFIWAMVDEAVVRTDLNNVLDANGLNANDGILGPHREKEGSFYALREIFSPIQVSLPGRITINFNGRVPLENRFHFTNASQCQFSWALVNFSKPFERLNGYSIRKKGILKSPDLPPLARGELQLDLPDDFKSYDALLLMVKDPQGRELYKWTMRIQPVSNLLPQPIATSNKVLVKETDSTISLSGAEITIHLDRKTGKLLSSKNTLSDYVLSFNNGPVLVGGNAQVKDVKIFTEGESQVAAFTYEGNMKQVLWKMQPNGWVSLNYSYELKGDYPFSGISFNYPENFVLSSRWLGKGPARQWKNRTAGTPTNVWMNLYNDTKTGYNPVVYPEFKGYYGEVDWMELSTVEGKFLMASPEPGLFVRLFDFYGLSSAGKTHPELPLGNISFLDAIPPIGSKLAMGLTTNTRIYGPQSETNHLDGTKSRTLLFYFGTPKLSNTKETYSRPLVDEVF